MDARSADASARRRIAFLLPVYNEADGIARFHETLTETTVHLEERYDVEFIYVDDGSRDESLARLLELREADARVSVIGLSRNFGHQIAVTAALDASDADAAIIMDTDLQDPPGVCLELVEKWELGADVVYAQRRSRNDTVFKRVSANVFYRLLDRMAAIEIPRNTGDFRLLDRTVVDELTRYREHNRFLRGLVSYVGFRQEAVLFDRDARFAGTTGYPLKKMLRFAGDGIFAFSTIPLVLISRIGFLFSFLSMLGVAYALAVRIFTPENAVPGWAFLAIVLLLIGGIKISMLGILGSYLGRVYTEVQNRPLYAVAVRAGTQRESPPT
jgi:glycosyltransferase involved in cell wall biosynthesis